MTKIAQLHNGTEIHFPDDTPDNEMDSAVQRHLGTAPSPQNDELMKTIMGAVATHMATQDNKQSQVSGQNMEDRAKADKQHGIVIDTMRQGHLMARQDNDGLTRAIAPLLAKLAQNSDMVVKAIQGLAMVVAEVGKAHVEAQTMDKEIITDANKKPVGLRSVKKAK